ncbi:BgTH12-05507 [Blumeria graminis f. sp. triticale]|uniref:BgTH12-05507 n=1 Tax=Blumeria graminis f. sp. triticale TaxID=1689686 RepID=A0A9W4D8A7_BLUGR|nr:BgTH12-05507 [Blumeria graminis f. sp. triticale]
MPTDEAVGCHLESPEKIDERKAAIGDRNRNRKDKYGKILEESYRSLHDMRSRLNPEVQEYNYHTSDRRDDSYAGSSFVSDNEQNSESGTGGSNSHHGGEMDDVFSDSGRSQRSSINSFHENAPSEKSSQKSSMMPTDVDETTSRSDSHIPISRSPSGISYPGSNPSDLIMVKPKTRSPFRSPSSVRAIQMTSPTPSMFPSSLPSDQKLSSSRRGTLNVKSTPNKTTPTRLKRPPKDPLVLLHITIMPLKWPYSYISSSSEVPESIKTIQETWRLLQDKVGNTVLERGILLAHPQDSYETLEERLLEALELPLHVRARILKCGHYIGSSYLETFTTDEAQDDSISVRSRDSIPNIPRKCLTCGREILFQELKECKKPENRFCIKVFASNGLMSPGAWTAAWREMERVDVEIEPHVEPHVREELERLAPASQHLVSLHHDDDDDDEDFDREEMTTRYSSHLDIDHEKGEEELRIEAELREHEQREEMRRNATVKEEEEREKEVRRITEEMSRNYGRSGLERSASSRSSRQSTVQESPRKTTKAAPSAAKTTESESFLQLLFAAVRVILQDKRNILIGLLTLFLLGLGIVPGGLIMRHRAPQEPYVPKEATSRSEPWSAEPPTMTTTVFAEKIVTRLITVPAPTAAAEKSIVPVALPSEVLDAPQHLPHASDQASVPSRYFRTRPQNMPLMPVDRLQTIELPLSHLNSPRDIDHDELSLEKDEL